MASFEVSVYLDASSDGPVGITSSSLATLDTVGDTLGISSCTTPEIMRSLRTSFILTVVCTTCCSNLACCVAQNLAASSATLVASISTAWALSYPSVAGFYTSCNCTMWSLKSISTIFERSKAESLKMIGSAFNL